MTKKRTRIIVVSIACIAVTYLVTLGIHFSRYVRAYCKSDTPNAQPEVYVLMDPVYYTVGIPGVCTSFSDALPYPLDILVMVDDRVEGDGAVIESFEAVFADGTTNKVVYPDAPRGDLFAEYTPVASQLVPGRTFRRAAIGIPGAILRRGSFTISVRGYIYGRQKQSFNRHLRMDYNREFNIYTGWRLLAGASC